MSHQLAVIVHGAPAPQGSKVRMPNGAMLEASKKVKPWRIAISEATTLARQLQSFTPDKDSPYSLAVVFTLPRPGHHWRTGKHSHQLKDSAPSSPATMPDLDKLLRSTLDGLADGGALSNDSRVVSIQADKAFPGGHLDALDEPGAVIVLRKA